MRHGIDCPKRPHEGYHRLLVGQGTDYLHTASDDGPYDVDGVSYCGRCHVALCAEPSLEQDRTRLLVLVERAEVILRDVQWGTPTWHDKKAALLADLRAALKEMEP